MRIGPRLAGGLRWKIALNGAFGSLVAIAYRVETQSGASVALHAEKEAVAERHDDRLQVGRSHRGIEERADRNFGLAIAILLKCGGDAAYSKVQTIASKEGRSPESLLLDVLHSLAFLESPDPPSLN